jgi:RimJ/RimL family protein N-acetyltransferase
MSVVAEASAALTLRPFGPGDFAALRAWFGDEAALIQWGGADMRYPLTDADLGRMLAESEGEPPRRWLFSGTRGPELVAHAQVALDWRHGVARLARVGLAPSARGRGLAVPFLRMVLDQAWARPEIERAELNVYTFNAAAIGAYRRLGFVEEGVRRRAVKAGAARWDSAMYALLRDERR